MKRVGSFLLLVFLTIGCFAQLCPDNNHPHAIDLGLPSGTLWACCNLGASSPEQFGDKYAWGETKPKSSYTEVNYTCGINEWVDIAGTEYDAATVNWGMPWRIPNYWDQYDELFFETTLEVACVNGVYGRKYTGKNGNSIFIPAELVGVDDNNACHYVSEYLLSEGGNWNDFCHCFSFHSMICALDNSGDPNYLKIIGHIEAECYKGYLVRPVIQPLQTIVTCSVNNSYDGNFQDKEANGFTADGTSEIVIGLSNESIVFDENVSNHFYLSGEEIGENMAGLVKEVKYFKDSIAIILKAPSEFLQKDGSEYTVEMRITPYSNGVAQKMISTTYKVLRPGVLLLHGFRGHSSSYNNMKNYLVSTGLYGRNQILAYNYSSTNTDTFYENTHINHVVKKGCEDLCRQLFEQDGIVSARYDLVGHSMGGILERLYAQEVENGKESTNRIITINTPHYGSKLGNTFGWVATLSSNLKTNIEHASDEIEKQKWAKTFVDVEQLSNILYYAGKEIYTLDAGLDLAVGSPAITNLNGANASNLAGIPVHSLCTYVEDASLQEFLQPKIKDIKPFDIQGRASLLWEGLITKGKPYVALAYYKELSDMVVPLSSQKGGLVGSNTSVFSGNVNHAMHQTSLQWGTVHQEVARLLQAERYGNDFSLSGFPSNSTANARQNAQEETNSEYIESFKLPREGSFLSATIQSVNSFDYTHLCMVRHSDDVQTFEVFAIPNDSTLVFGIDEKEIKFNLKDSPTEKLMFYVVGRTNYDALLLDSVEIILDPRLLDVDCRIEKNAIHIDYNAIGTTVHFSSALNNGTWTLHAIDGMLLQKGHVDDRTILLKKRTPGIYILNVRKENKRYTYKLCLRNK